MGGVAGHMDHLYDNHDLTFFKMKLSTQVIVMDIGDLEPGMKYF